MGSQRIAIEVEHVHKSYRVPVHRVETFKERALHPFRSVEYSELRALEDVSFDIKAGEFFGIAGRNGSGKTTLLKLLASIYASDRGRIRIAGRVAPFIELGVGFNPDLAARDNIMLNGVMMGLTPSEAAARSDRVIEFAELEDFVEMKLKNYSSGMRVRLGFAMLVEADADILLIDEVLAVGDAAFQQKCTDVFYDFKKRGRTIVLVTHAMEKLKEYCDRAVLLHDARVDAIGDPEEVGNRYLELNFKRDGGPAASDDVGLRPGDFEGPARITAFRFEDSGGRPADRFKHSEPIHFSATVEVREQLDRLCFGLLIENQDGGWLTSLRTPDMPESGGPLMPRERIQIHGRIGNPLASGRYYGNVGLTDDRESNHPIDAHHRAAEFLVFGSDKPGGYTGAIVPDHEFSYEREGRQRSPSGAAAARDGDEPAKLREVRS
jgi:ABC-2 type transport system ATP-binding protein